MTSNLGLFIGAIDCFFHSPFRELGFLSNGGPWHCCTPIRVTLVISHSWASNAIVLWLYCLLQTWKFSVCYGFLSKEFLMLWHWGNRKQHQRRQVCVRWHKEHTEPFSLPTFSWVILTAVHGAAWCHRRLSLPRLRPRWSETSHAELHRCHSSEATLKHWGIKVNSLSSFSATFLHMIQEHSVIGV